MSNIGGYFMMGFAAFLFIRNNDVDSMIAFLLVILGALLFKC